MRKHYLLPILIIFAIALAPATSGAAGTALEEVLREAGNTRSEGHLPVVIFDLDGTLFHTGFRSKQIFLDHAREQGDTTLENKLNAIDPVAVSYVVRKTLIESGITDSTTLKALIDSWRRKFFSDDYLQYDEQVPGSVAFVNALHDSGTLIVYLTGRDAPGMLLGTTASLAARGFPVGVAGTELIMKPERYMKTYRFKAQALSYIGQLGKVIAFFENEPENLNLGSERFPEAIACFLETHHKPNAPPVTEAAHRMTHYLLNLPLKPVGPAMEQTE